MNEYKQIQADATRLMIFYALNLPCPEPSALQVSFIYWQPKMWFFSLDKTPEFIHPSLEYEIQGPNSSFTSNFWNYTEINKIVWGVILL